MKCKLFLLSLTLLSCSTATQAQVRFTEDPNTAINMDIEAKSESAILNIQTFSRTNQIVPDAYVVITFMNDSIIKLTGPVRNNNRMIESDAGHGFADRFNSNARLIISPSQAELFKNGIKSLMIRMAPNAFYHEWKDDEIGKPLYARYLISKENVMFKKKD
jgi:hypothetical protein